MTRLENILQEIEMDIRRKEKRAIRQGKRRIWERDLEYFLNARQVVNSGDISKMEELLRSTKFLNPRDFEFGAYFYIYYWMDKKINSFYFELDKEIEQLRQIKQ